MSQSQMSNRASNRGVAQGKQPAKNRARSGKQRRQRNRVAIVDVAVPPPLPPRPWQVERPSGVAAKSGYLGDLANMIVNPKDFEPVRSPSEFATTGDVKKFTRTFSFGAAQSVGTNFAMVVTPTIENFFSLTKNVGITSPNPMDAADPADLVFAQTQQTLFYEANGTFVVTDGVTQVPLGSIETSLFQGKQSLIVNTPAGQNVNLRGTNGNQGCVFTGFYWDPVLLAWITLPSVSSAPYAPFGFGFVPPNGIGALCLQSSRLSTRVTANVQVPALSAFGALAASYNLFNSAALELGKVERYRVTALSVLASYSGNQFNDGGVIAAARCGPGYTFGDDPYESLTKLTDHEYHGPIKTGAYAFWLPNSYQEREYLPGTSSPDDGATNLRIAGSFADPNGSLTITITTVVEFYSPLQIFSHLSGPVVSPSYYQLLRDLDAVPAAICNPLHTDLLKLLQRGAKHAIGYAMKNPQIIQQALAAIAGMI